MAQHRGEQAARLAVVFGALLLVVLHVAAGVLTRSQPGDASPVWWLVLGMLSLVGGIAVWAGWWPLAAAAFALAVPLLQLWATHLEDDPFALVLTTALAIVSVWRAIEGRGRHGDQLPRPGTEALLRIAVGVGAVVLVASWHALMFLVSAMTMSNTGFVLNIAAAIFALVAGVLVAVGRPWWWGVIGFAASAVLDVALLLQFTPPNPYWVVAVPVALALVCWWRQRVSIQRTHHPADAPPRQAATGGANVAAPPTPQALGENPGPRDPRPGT